ncbi:MAG: tRNA (adenosine(37)-N6)-threonylcarbamoyltransferase complex ATPase subunit type 1 TsaE [Rhodospirillales bacterium]
MTARTLILAAEDETAALAARLAARAGAGDVFLLSGGLGMGKTAFARGFIRALVPHADEIPSPTFTLAQTYQAAGFEIHHYDLHRVERPDDVLELGVEESFAEAVTLIEWPERLGRYTPTDHIEIVFTAPDGAPGGADDADGADENENVREVTLKGFGAGRAWLAEADFD